MTSGINLTLNALTSRKGAMGGAAAVLGCSILTTAVMLGSLATVDRAGGFVTPALAQAAAPSTDVSKVFTSEQRQAIEQVVRDFLVAHPEVLLEVTKELEQRQQALMADAQRKLIIEKKASIFKASTDYVFGNPKGNIAVVEFFDYNCGWCKRAVDELTKLTKADPNVRVIMKELPIFGDNSAFAAKAAMASIAQGKYWDFHVAMMREKQVTKENTFRIAEKVGIDVARLKRDMENPALDAALKANQDLAQGLGIEGTPGFIVDTKVNVGFVPADGLKEMIAEIRKAGCQVC
ncbi:MAG: DsbA family protein [Hyphomicrobiaceae bacterium]